MYITRVYTCKFKEPDEKPILLSYYMKKKGGK